MTRAPLRRTGFVVAFTCTVAAFGCESDEPSAPARRISLDRAIVAPHLGSAPAPVNPDATAQAGGAPYEQAPAPMPADSPEARAARLETAVDAARAAFDAEPRSELAAIWLGRRIAYTGRFDEAIDVFTEALGAHPDSYRLLRHRGHRFLTVRRFDDAIADLSLAARFAAEASMDRALAAANHLPADAPAVAIAWDEIEPDGAPNSLGVPRSATRFNIYYHLALAHYIRSAPGDLEAAALAYERCAEFSRRNDDMTVATANWRYLALRRLGRVADARAVLEPIHAGMNCLEDADYLTLCLLHKGEIAPDEALAHAVPPGSTRAETIAYGVGMWHLLRGDASGRDSARRIFRAIVENPDSARASFAYIAAEQELARLRVE